MDRTPELKFVGRPGQELAVWEWPGEDPPFLFAHATGFHGRCWDYIIRRFPERHCLATDARGHGRSSQPELPYHWRIFGRDMTAVAEHFDVRDAIGIGHSSGGHTTVQAAALRPQTYRALLLVVPDDLPDRLVWRGSARRVGHPAAPEHLGVAGRNVRTLQRSSAVLALAAGDPAGLLRLRRAAARRAIRARLPARGGGVDLSALKGPGGEYLCGGRAGTATRCDNARTHAAEARGLRSGGVPHTVGSGVALCSRTRHRAARGFALHRHGRTGPCCRRSQEVVSSYF